MSHPPENSSRCRPLSLSHRSRVESPTSSSDSSSSDGKELVASRPVQHAVPDQRLSLNQPLNLHSSSSNSDASYAVAFPDRQRSNTKSNANEEDYRTHHVDLPFMSNSKAIDKSFLKMEDNISTFMNFMQDQAKVLNSFREEKEQIQELYQQQTEKYITERQEYESLHCELDEMQENLQKSTGNETKLNARILQLKNQLGASLMKNEHLTKEINVLKQQNTEQAQQLENERENMRNARAGETKIKEEFVRVSQSKQKVQEELQYLQRKLEEQTNQKDDIIADRDAWHANVTKLERELEQVKRDMEQKSIHQNMEVQDLHCIIDQEKRKINTMQETLESKRKEISQLQNREVNYNGSTQRVLEVLEKHIFLLCGTTGKIKLLFADNQRILESINETSSTLRRIRESLFDIKSTSISVQKVEKICSWIARILIESGILDTKLVELLQNEIRLGKTNKSWITKSQQVLNCVVAPLNEALFNYRKVKDCTSSLGRDLQKIISLNSKEINLLRKQLLTANDRRVLCENISNQRGEQINNLQEKIQKQEARSCEWVQKSKKNDVIVQSSIKSLRDTLERQRLLFQALKTRALESKTFLTEGIELSVEALRIQNHEKLQLLAQLREVTTGLKRAEQELECVTQLAHTDHKKHATLIQNLNTHLSQMTFERDRYKDLLSSSGGKHTVIQEKNQQSHDIDAREVADGTIDCNQKEQLEGADEGQELESNPAVSDKKCHTQKPNHLTDDRPEQSNFIPKCGSKRQKRNTTARRVDQQRSEKSVPVSTGHLQNIKTHSNLNVRPNKQEQAQGGRISKPTPRRSPNKRKHADRKTKLSSDPSTLTQPPKSAFRLTRTVRPEDDDDWVVQDVTLE